MNKRRRRSTWAARRKNQRALNELARRSGHHNHREWEFSSKVQRLRDLISGSIKNHDSAELFETKHVAAAIGASIEVVRELAHANLMPAEKLPNPKARKFLFTFESVERYLDSTGHPEAWGPASSRVFRSRKFSVNRNFVNREFVHKALAAAELKCSVHAVNYHIRRGNLEAVRLGHRLVAVTRRSLAKLSWKRLRDAERQLELSRRQLQSAQRKFDQAQKNLKKLYGADGLE